MARFSSLSVLLALSALASPAAAQSAIEPHAQLVTLEHESEEVQSGLAAIRRELMRMGLRSTDEMGAARLVLTLEDHFVGLSPVSAMFSVDGQPLFHSSDRAEIEGGAIFTGAIPSGPHILSVRLEYRGDVLYTTGYHTRIVSSYAFDTTLGRTTHVRVIGHDTSVLAAPPDRWTVDYAVETDPRP